MRQAEEGRQGQDDEAGGGGGGGGGGGEGEGGNQEERKKKRKKRSHQGETTGEDYNDDIGRPHVQIHGGVQQATNVMRRQEHPRGVRMSIGRLKATDEALMGARRTATLDLRQLQEQRRK
jgi:hypothetical protein